MRDPLRRHFWRNPVVLTFAVLMLTAATITFAWRETAAPGDLVELAEGMSDGVRKSGAANDMSQASKWLYMVRSAAGTPSVAPSAELEAVTAPSGIAVAAEASAGRASGASSNRFGFSGNGQRFGRRSGGSDSFAGGGGGGFGGAGGWGGVSGTAPRRNANGTERATTTRTRPNRESRSSSGGGSGSAGTAAPDVVAGASGELVDGAAVAGGSGAPSPAPAPEPISLLLIGSGLATAYGLRRYLVE